LEIANEINNSFVNLEYIHRLHRFQIYWRDEISIIIINMHVVRWMIANPPNENVAATTNPTPFLNVVPSEDSLSILKVRFGEPPKPAREPRALPQNFR